MELNKKSFTLIEMLIVVVIIGILAAALIPRIQSAQGRARDTKRMTDVAQINTASNIYYMDKGSYVPSAATAVSNAVFGGYREGSIEPNFMSALTPDYLTSVPRDPLNQISDNKRFMYRYNYYQRPPTGYHWACPDYKGGFAIILAIAFEALPTPTSNMKCPGQDWQMFGVYAQGFLYKGDLQVKN